MAEIEQTHRSNLILAMTLQCCKKYRHEFIMPEHLLSELLNLAVFSDPLDEYCKVEEVERQLNDSLDKIERVPEGIEYEPTTSAQMGEVIDRAFATLRASECTTLDLPHLVRGILSLEDSWAAHILKSNLNGHEADFLSSLISSCELDDDLDDMLGFNHDDEDLDDDDLDDEEDKVQKEKATSWKQLVTCMTDLYERRNPLIGREAELERTIQVLCRCDKNNPLHVGEPRVGKTALVWGLARRIAEGNVPERLRSSKIYQIDMGSLLAGTQYRGDFESRIKQIMSGIENEPGNNIVYIDEIHTLVGAGAIGDGAMDASNMLKPYLEGGNIRFIGSTTYEEYNRHFARSKGLIRRFQQIDIGEPSIDEAKNILRQLRSRYEEFHNVKYSDEAIDFAVDASAKHVNDRYLPDKAIDLIDEAGAAMEISAEKTEIGKKEIAEVLSKTCKVDALAEADDDEYARLENLSERMLSKIYGQDEAIRQVVESVQMSRAGLLDDNKPLASLLFVGPTGVGKTEVSRVLAKELGIPLIRFDMSEYTEKHAVAKLIGSPAGYVGYDDGGLLVDAIRKSPNSVLLLDEIEKAHQDIYNILLQVMDYARLTDNKGNKADFRNAIIIMTSNAGAQYASQGMVGFQSSMSRGDVMLKHVKKTFKPEFLNRLSGTVVFRDMDEDMARRILSKKLRELDEKLAAKKVTMTLSSDAYEHLLKEGFTREYGAREMDRVISQQLKPLLMREILFGTLKHGGTITIEMKDGSLSIG